MDFENIKKAAAGYEQAMTKFLRDLVKIPEESAGKKDISQSYCRGNARTGL